MKVAISDLQSVVEVPKKEIRRAVRATVSALDGLTVEDLSIALVDDAKISQLNVQFLNRDGPTDVLAFDLKDDDTPGISGEIIVSAETAKREAEKRGHSAVAETLFYVVHGLLHLAGWDDATPADRRRMLEKQADILKSIGYDVPLD